MAIDPTSAVGAATRVLPSAGPSLPSLTPTEGTDAAGFGDMVVGALENLNELHTTADTLAVQAATGDLAEIHDYTIAATQAEIATQLTVAVRDKAVEAFNDIMRMQF